MNERRTSPRFCLQRTVVGRILEMSHAFSQGAVVQDVSRGGLGLLLNKPMEPANLMCLEIPGKPEYVLGRIIHGATQQDGTWKAGFQLVDPLEEHDLQTLARL